MYSVGPTAVAVVAVVVVMVAVDGVAQNLHVPGHIANIHSASVTQNPASPNSSQFANGVSVQRTFASALPSDGSTKPGINAFQGNGGGWYLHVVSGNQLSLSENAAENAAGLSATEASAQITCTCQFNPAKLCAISATVRSVGGGVPTPLH